jgi:hypothetical protein
MPFDAQGITAIVCVAITLAALIRGRIGADLAMAGGIGLLVLTGILRPEEAFAGLASSSILTIALLLIVSQGAIETGLIQWIGPAIFGRTTNVFVAQLRLMLPVAAISAFINNTPLVAMCIPVVQEFSRRSRIAPGKLFIPLTFAATLGDACFFSATGLGNINPIFFELYDSLQAGECFVPHGGKGCNQPVCCNDVCSFDPGCCPHPCTQCTVRQQLRRCIYPRTAIQGQYPAVDAIDNQLACHAGKR